ncbi:filamentous hemagglutinin N-terminal domain-containing protein (plasmid) [Nostoc sp. UHCC 0302]|uniref:two-partner secretion domain-containing protein n=1 Tax=Nostoc sp. UHCC 0302 TaxID=3134896 RepID=UPI00311CB1EE
MDFSVKFMKSLKKRLNKNPKFKRSQVLFWSIQGSALSYLLFTCLSVTAQISPDKTLPINSQVTPQGNTNVIEGGTQKGNNWFHSFEQFSIVSGSTAYFNNSINIQNIFTRITGNSISNINGILKANGIANVFLINPNGIIFGPNAQLNIGGSFFASTANAIKFADGFDFKTNGSKTETVLTISRPIGLQITNNSGSIQVQGIANGLIAPSGLNSPIKRNISISGLRVAQGKTLALVGGDINLEGGNLTAEQGIIELGAVYSGFVSLSPVNQGWTLSYEGSPYFKNINLLKQSLIDASGNIGGLIVLQGKQISFDEGSIALIQNFGSQNWGAIKVNASESLKVSRVSSNGKFLSLLKTESIGSGTGGDIKIITNNLVLQEGGIIGTRNYSDGIGGNINIDAAKSVDLTGFSSSKYTNNSAINATSLSSGKAGDITVSTRNFSAQDGGAITSLARGSGDGGNVNINASNYVKLLNSAELINSGQEYINYIPSYLSAETVLQGNAGSLNLNTSLLVVGEHAKLNTSTRGFGNAGTLNINARNIKVSGTVNSSAIRADIATQKLFGSPSLPSGSPGEVIINAERLNITNGGQASITNEGTSTVGGKLTINAVSVSLDKKSSVAASTASGEGGEIQVNTRDLLLNDESTITASADNKGNGGNIVLNADIISALKNSGIAADAFEGRGGNITINAKGLFLSFDSFITASSQFGINGTVQFNIVDPHLYPIQLKVKGISEDPQVTSTCHAQAGTGVSNIVVHNFRSLQPNPNGIADNNLEQNAVEAVNNLQSPNSSTSKQPIEIIEANSVSRDSQGNLFLTTNEAIPTSDAASLSASSCFSAPQ